MAIVPEKNIQGILCGVSAGANWVINNAIRQPSKKLTTTITFHFRMSLLTTKAETKTSPKKKDHNCMGWS